MPDTGPASDSPSLAALLAGAGVALGDRQLEQLVAYRDLLHERNRVTNLTAVRDLPGIERRLLLESLRLAAPLREAVSPVTGRRPTMIDLGTGGGLPGMVLAIACPEIDVWLLDATGKKVAFLDDVVRALDLSHVTPMHGRAEEVAHQPRYREAFDVVTARAVSSLPALLELGLPLLRVNGVMLLPKGDDIAAELDAGARAAGILEAEITSSALLPDVGSTIETRLVQVRKLAVTPRAYPRRSGIPAKDPLGSTIARARTGRERGRGKGAS